MAHGTLVQNRNAIIRGGDDVTSGSDPLAEERRLVLAQLGALLLDSAPSSARSIASGIVEYYLRTLGEDEVADAFRALAA